jgi:hypothetical protein
MPQSKPAMDAGLTARSTPVTWKETSEGGVAVGDGCTVEEVEVEVEVAPGVGAVEEVEVACGVGAVEEVEVAPGVTAFGREPKEV